MFTKLAKEYESAGARDELSYRKRHWPSFSFQKEKEEI